MKQQPIRVFFYSVLFPISSCSIFSNLNVTCRSVPGPIKYKKERYCVRLEAGDLTRTQWIKWLPGCPRRLSSCRKRTCSSSTASTTWRFRQGRKRLGISPKRNFIAGVYHEGDLVVAGEGPDVHCTCIFPDLTPLFSQANGEFQPMYFLSPMAQYLYNRLPRLQQAGGGIGGGNPQELGRVSKQL